MKAKSKEKKKRLIPKLILTIQILTVVLGFYFVFSYVNNSTILSYIAEVVSPVQTRGLIPFIDEVDGYYSFINDNSGEEFRVLQLADIHMSCGIVTFVRDKAAVDSIVQIVNNTKPDLIILTGDNIYPSPFTMSMNNSLQIQAIANLFEGFQIPWAVVYGNHDAETYGVLSKTDQSAFYESLDYCLFQRGPDNITGQGNYVIKVLNNDLTLSEAIFLMDSNEYAGLLRYDKIHDDQIDWYKNEVINLAKRYYNYIESDNEAIKYLKTSSVRSLLYIHIPLNEYKTAIDLWNNYGDSVEHEVFLLWGVNRKRNCVPHEQGKMFDAILALGSTKAVFAGHDHDNNWTIQYKGVQLTYGMSIDFIAMFQINNRQVQRGGTLVDIGNDNTDLYGFMIKPVPQTNNYQILTPDYYNLP